MDNQLSYSQLQTLKQKAQETNRQKYLESCRLRLTKILAKKMETVMIGSLAAFEETFGFLWGYNKETSLTKEEKTLKTLWDNTRTKILDNGNHQIRAVYNEVSNHIVSWNRYHIDFKVIQDQDQDQDRNSNKESEEYYGSN
jgi:hypothetical protein